MANLLGIAVYDKVTNQHACFQFCNSKAEFLRCNVESLILACKNLNDLQPRVLCEYDSVTGEIIPKTEDFSFSEYKMPLSKADALAPLGVDFSKEALEYAEFKKSRENKSE